MDGKWQILRKKQELGLDATAPTSVDDALFSGADLLYLYIVQAPDGSVHRVRARSDGELWKKIAAGEFADDEESN